MNKEKFIPKDKLSKRSKRKLNLAQRATWGINPITRKATNPKAYNRNKARRDMDDYPHDGL